MARMRKKIDAAQEKNSYFPTAVDGMDGIFSYITGDNAPAAGQCAEKIG
ncbi:hypothetical protein [Paenibacillus luteus]|nr:hypothetical protein [Paenibacillus luteus]